MGVLGERVCGCSVDMILIVCGWCYTYRLFCSSFVCLFCLWVWFGCVLACLFTYLLEVFWVFAIRFCIAGLFVFALGCLDHLIVAFCLLWYVLFGDLFCWFGVVVTLFVSIVCWLTFVSVVYWFEIMGFRRLCWLWLNVFLYLLKLLYDLLYVCYCWLFDWGYFAFDCVLYSLVIACFLFCWFSCCFDVGFLGFMLGLVVVLIRVCWAYFVRG